MRTPLCLLLLVALLPAASPLRAQKNATGLTDVATVNKILGTHLQYNPESPVNKLGRYECRYTDPNSNNLYVAINLLESKVQYGYDVLKSEFEHAKTEIAAGRTILAKYTGFSPYPPGGAYAYYLTGPKDKATEASVLFKFRKGDYIVAMTAEGLDVATVTARINALYNALKAKL